MIPLHASAYSHVEIIGAQLVYYPQVETQYALQLGQLKNKQSGFVSKDAEWQLYQRISETTYGSPTPLTAWNQQVGSAPLRFFVQLVVKNYGNQVSPPLPVSVAVSAKTGTFLVRPDTLMVDRPALRRTAKWEAVSTLRDSLPTLAPNEKLTFQSKAIDLGRYLVPLNQRFPVILRANVAFGDQQRTLDIPVMPPPVALHDLPRK